jgi:hypothetical protein
VTSADEPAAPRSAHGGTAIRCLIADNQAMVRESFAGILAAQPGITVAYSRGAAVVVRCDCDCRGWRHRPPGRVAPSA